jgi:hypothetical protein
VAWSHDSVLLSIAAKLSNAHRSSCFHPRKLGISAAISFNALLLTYSDFGLGAPGGNGAGDFPKMT